MRRAPGDCRDWTYLPGTRPRIPPAAQGSIEAAPNGTVNIGPPLDWTGQRRAPAASPGPGVAARVPLRNSVSPMTRPSWMRAVLLCCALPALACQPAGSGPAGARHRRRGRRRLREGAGGAAAGSTGTTSTGGTARGLGAGGSGGGAAGSDGAGGSATAGTGRAGGSAGTGTGGTTAGSGGSTTQDAAVDHHTGPVEAGAAETAPPSGERASAACGKGGPVPAEGLHTLKVGMRRTAGSSCACPPRTTATRPGPAIFAFHGAGNKDADLVRHAHRAAPGERGQGRAGVRRVAVPPRQHHRAQLAGRGPAARQPGLHRRDRGLAAHQPVRRQPAPVRRRSELGRVLLARRSPATGATCSGRSPPPTAASACSSDCKGHPGAFIRYRPGSADGGAMSKQARDFWIKHNSCRPGTQPTNTPPCVAYAGCTEDAHLWECADGGDARLAGLHGQGRVELLFPVPLMLAR